MMNKNNVIYFVVVVVMLAIVYFFVFQRPASTLTARETNFAVEDTAAIGTIYMSNLSGESITLKRKENEWIVNDKYRARPAAIRTLLTTIRNVRVSAPVPHSAHNNVVRDMAAYHTKVEIYSKRHRLLKAYYVGSAAPNNQGTYMKLEGAKNVYIIYLPGFEGYLTPRYFLNEEEWRDRVVFQYAPSSIRKVSVVYERNPELPSFSIEVIDNDSFRVQLLSGEKGAGGGYVNKDAVREYLEFFRFIAVEGFANRHTKKDSVLLTTPYCVITVIDLEGRENTVKCYLMPITQRSKMTEDHKGNPLQFDQDRMFALVNNGQDFAVIQFFVFGKLLKTYYDFIHI